MTSDNSTENPTLAVALGRVLRVQRHQFANENGINLKESLNAIAKRCKVCTHTLQNIEAGSDDPGRSLLIRMVESGVYNISGAKIFAMNDVIHTIRKSSTSTAKSVFKHSPDLIELIELSEEIKDRECKVTFRNNIDRKGLFAAVYQYLSDDFYTSQRRRCYCEIAKEEDYPLLEKNQPVPGYWSLEDYKRFGAKNPQSFAIVYKDQSKRRYIGQFRFAALTESGVGKLFLPATSNKKTLSIENYAPSFTECVAVSVGVSGIDNKYTRGLLLLELLYQIEQLLAFPNIKILFAHTLHSEGKLLADKFDFEYVPESDVRFLTITTRRLNNFGLQPNKIHYK